MKEDSKKVVIIVLLYKSFEKRRQRPVYLKKPFSVFTSISLCFQKLVQETMKTFFCFMYKYLKPG